MARMREVAVAAESVERFAPFVTPELKRRLDDLLAAARARASGRVIWHINSTPRGGGVAELLRGLLGYLRGAGIDARWLTIEGTPEFFKITKRLHHAIHGAPGDGSPLGEAERRLVEQVAWDNAEEFLSVLSPGDLVWLHDPQTAALRPALERAGARCLWRCHIGTDQRNAHTEEGWRFLRPFVEGVRSAVFSRREFIPDFLGAQGAVLHPSIDIFSPKNQPMAPETARAILVHAGLISGPDGADRSFLRSDGAPGRVDRVADLTSTGIPPAWDAPLVVQVSRWDPLKDPIGVMHGFAALMRTGRCCPEARLILAGPSVHAVKDDPEGGTTLDAVIDAWRKLPAHERHRITLACLPMADVEENAAMVNALQRHATVLVQKSLQEGFGLTVTEAMWKRKPVIASAVGGIREQVVHGVSGLLLDDPADLQAFAGLLETVLTDPALAARLGAAAEERVREQFLAVRQLIEGMSISIAVDEAASSAPQPAAP